MFDVGFWEMMLVGIVALLAFGPERLPRVARETALWVRKARSMVASVKQDIDHELQLYELQEALRREKKALSSFDLEEPPKRSLNTVPEHREHKDPEPDGQANNQAGGR
ncbi:MAG: Sec-independent protein translocase protein TatB [Methylotetracoccus sp.]|nr:Sec-independent protein translocase protein TatB [Methylotetracoccus sp.]